MDLGWVFGSRVGPDFPADVQTLTTRCLAVKTFLPVTGAALQHNRLPGATGERTCTIFGADAHELKSRAAKRPGGGGGSNGGLSRSGSSTAKQDTNLRNLRPLQ